MTDGGQEDEVLPVTSYACKWKPPRKRKQTTLQFTEAEFHKPVYGCQVKHTLSTIADFDPRPADNRGKASDLLQGFLKNVKGDSLGISMLNDPTMQVWREEIVDQDLSQSLYSLVTTIKREDY